MARAPRLMRLLLLAPSPPHPTRGGGALRMFHMIRFLGERFQLDLVAPALEGAEEADRLLRESCRDLEFVRPSHAANWRRGLRLGPYQKDSALADAISRRLSHQTYTAIQLEKPAMLPYLPSGIRIPIILDTWAFGLTGARRALRHQTGMLTRARNLLRLIRFSAFDAFRWPDTHCILVVSEEDRKRCLRKLPKRNVLVVPNGVDCSTLRPGPFIESGPPSLVFTGDMGFEPNVDAALLLATRIFPEISRIHPDASLHLVGRNPDPRLSAISTPGITVTGKVEDMLPYLQAATVYVAPLTTGAGTRTKLLEAMASGLPIVTSSVGIEGIEAVVNRDVVIADDAAKTIAAVLRLLEAPAERHRLGAAARELAEQRYDWPCCLAPLESLYSELVANHSVVC